ncbi:helix-turn-helix domain-containing protein [Streptomyces milbemycinicus]|uniref:helix-turn-helix domain-containing protein n=1 Tax=Streptomyces milbemycinicus TaxID=476552 RepID=UPI0033D54A56
MNGPATGPLPLTLAELLQHGPLGGVTVYGPAERTTEVRAVRIADRLDALDGLQPHTAVVLTAGAATASWTLEMALRKAWEHAAACVVVARDTGRPESVAELADRLGVPLLVVAGDALDTAVRIASALARPEAGRTELIATAARRITAAGTHPVRVVSALHAVLPSTSVALTAPLGELVAGRTAALDERAGPVCVRVEVADPDGGPLAALTARSRSRVAGWDATVREVLGLAVAPLTAWAARERLAAERTGRRAAGLLAELVARAGSAPQGRAADSVTNERAADGASGASEAYDPLLAEAVALGWPVHGPFLLYAVRPAGPDEPGHDHGALLTAWWARGGPGGPLVSYAGCWVAWERPEETPGATAPEETPGAAPEGTPHAADPVAGAEKRLRAALAKPAPPLPVAGAVAGPAAGLAELGPALADAVAAVRVARSGDVVRADRMGPDRFLAALPREALRGPAEMLLAPLLHADRDGSLLRTLATLLDVGTPSAAAARLGVHRNTVTARLERIRSLGCDPDDPALRLALHLACRVLLGRTPPDKTPPDTAAGQP